MCRALNVSMLLSQISSISSQNRVHSRRNTFFRRFVGESIGSYALGYTVNDHIYVIYPAYHTYLADFTGAEPKQGTE